jgi:prepilin-type N-terminal cleavage/methylation domain-containing protein
MMAPALKGGRGGFSLIEVAVAITILGVVLVALAGLTFQTANRTKQLSDAGTRQAMLLQEVNRLSVIDMDSLVVQAGCQATAVGGHQLNRCVTVRDSIGWGLLVGVRIESVRDTRVDSVSFLRPRLRMANPLMTGG